MGVSCSCGRCVCGGGGHAVMMECRVGQAATGEGGMLCLGCTCTHASTHARTHARKYARTHAPKSQWPVGRIVSLELGRPATFSLSCYSQRTSFSLSCFSRRTPSPSACPALLQPVHLRYLLPM